jgi:thiol-disulfide isomerase/thioredoxin
MKPGMYRLVYKLPQDLYFFDIIFDGKEDVVFEFSEQTGVQFSTSEENKLWTGFKTAVDVFQQSIDGMYAEESPKPKVLKGLFAQQRTFIKSYKDAANGKIAQVFIDAYAPYIPEDAETIDQYTANRKKAFLTNADFNSEWLQKSGLPIELAVKYIFNFVDKEQPLLASHKANIDDVMKSLSTTSVLFKKTLQADIWRFLVANAQIDAANYLADAYLLPLSKEAQDTNLYNEVFLVKSLSIGQIAPDFTWKNETDDNPKTKRFSEIEAAEKHIIMFWSSGCSHCLDEIPKVHQLAKTLGPEKLKVIAVGLEDEPYKWRNLTMDMPELIHVLGLGRWENSIGNQYDVSATPTYFILDKDKKIIAKPETLEDVLALFAPTE